MGFASVRAKALQSVAYVVLAASVCSSPAGSSAAELSSSWGELPNWSADDHEAALSAFRSSCAVIQTRREWRDVCADAKRWNGASARVFFESRFRPYRLGSQDSADEGLVTGYYEPTLRGSRTRAAPYLYPVYGPPDDLLNVDIPGFESAARDLRLRGRLADGRIVPYYSRAEIEAGHAPIAGKELLWVDDRIDLFFLHVQGSGRVRLTDGSVVHLGYANTNGLAYRSIGRTLVDQGELALDKASADAIRAWALLHPERLDSLLNTNESYIFFRVLPDADVEAPGTLGVPLVPGRSIAVDPRFIPLGAPVFLASTYPGSGRPLQRLVVALDTGSAIRGATRADFYWGSGPEAERQAARMRQPARMWVLLPKEAPPPMRE